MARRKKQREREADTGASESSIRRAQALLRSVGRTEARKTVDWDIQPLGRVSDAELSRVLRVSQEAVLAARRVRHVPCPIPSSKRTDWDIQPLGKMSDRDLAKSLGVTEWTVGAQRKRRGIPVFDQINWDLEPLGQVSDYELARRHGVRVNGVREARIRRGIPALNSKHTPTKKVDMSEASDELLFQDATWLATKLGVDADSVRREQNRQAKKRGIERSPRHRNSGISASHIDWSNVPLGLASDASIASEIGCSRAAVSIARKKAGIPPFGAAARRGLPGFVYAVRSSVHDMVKIGRAKSVVDRLMDLAHMNPGGLVVVAVLKTEDAAKIETDLHLELEEHRSHGEWFRDGSHIAQAMSKYSALATLPEIVGQTVPTAVKGEKHDRDSVWVRLAYCT